MATLKPEEPATPNVSRRQFMETASMAALGTALHSVTAEAQAPPAAPPNILLIISDEHNASVTGCYGNDTIQTPNLDQLAARGVVFEKCYTNSPLCVPSRLSITSGKYSSRVGAWSNSCWLPSADYPSIARVVQTRGYETFLTGKMHYDRTRRYGFTEIGKAVTNQEIKTGKGGRRAFDDTNIDLQAWYSRSSQFRSGDKSQVLNHDRAALGHACDFLANRKSSASPFFLVVGFLAPHFPLVVPEEFHAPYRGRIKPPHLPLGHLEMQPLNYQHLRHGFGNVKTDPEVVIKGREYYHGLTQWCDNNIGQVLEALAKSDAAKNTVVIYTSDHGENMGEHGLWWKNCMYDNASRVPLIVSWPGHWQAAGRRQGACSLVDVVQTMAAIAGAPTPEDWNGNSLVPWLHDGNHAWKDLAVSEYYAHNIASGYAMLRHENYKYVYHTQPTPDFPAQRELYDLSTDPDEFVNLASIPEQQKRIREYHALLIKEIGEDPEKTEKRCRADFAEGYHRSVPREEAAPNESSSDGA
jgi:choline-sulfatase